ncbi:MAG: tetratricopeptide repeat protein, partial [bacterium]
MKAEPDFAEALFFVGALLQEQGRHREATASLRRVLRIKPNLALPRVYLSALLEKAGERADAQAELDRATKQNPASVNVTYGFEEFYFREGGANEILAFVRPKKAPPPRARLTPLSPKKPAAAAKRPIAARLAAGAAPPAESLAGALRRSRAPLAGRELFSSAPPASFSGERILRRSRLRP